MRGVFFTSNIFICATPFFNNLRLAFVILKFFGGYDLSWFFKKNYSILFSWERNYKCKYLCFCSVPVYSAPTLTLWFRIEMIDSLFCHDTVEEIVDALVSYLFIIYGSEALIISFSWRWCPYLLYTIWNIEHMKNRDECVI